MEHLSYEEADVLVLNPAAIFKKKKKKQKWLGLTLLKEY